MESKVDHDCRNRLGGNILRAAVRPCFGVIFFKFYFVCMDSVPACMYVHPL